MSNGRSEQEQLDRLEGKVDEVLIAVTEHRIFTRAELGRRPTRGEVLSWVTLGAVLISGVVNFIV